MTLKLQLSPHLERRLEAQAAKLGLLLDVYALTLLEKQLRLESETISPSRPRRQPGSAKGLIEMASDFDEPLEDFEAYR